MQENIELINVENVTFGYDIDNEIINDISFKVWKGDRIGLIGPNGVGKTTLFKLICGIDKPQKGKITICQRELKQGEFRPELGMIFQNTDDQLFCPTVYDDVSFGPRNMGMSNEEVDKNVNEAFEILNISYLKDKAPHHLSGGEKRLVSIAGILSMKSKIGIYDEPTSNLDIRYKKRLIKFLKSSHHEAIIVSSHDLEFILQVCNKIILFDEGKIIAIDSPETILADSELMNLHGLEKPYSLTYTCGCTKTSAQ